VFGPAKYTESEVLVGFLDQQLTAIRAAAYGLSEQQARATPCASTLSVGGLVKHATYVLSRRTQPQADPSAMPDSNGLTVFMDSFALGADETLAEVLAAFDQTRSTYLAAVRATDPGGEWTAPPAPWEGRNVPSESVQRFALVHHIEELARHAGHADIIREQLDGAAAASLLMAVEGREGNDFIQPWTAPA
jgi:hypothetical protein